MRKLFFATVFVLALFLTTSAEAAYMSRVSDLIVNSQPNAATSHIITFTVTNAVPAGGKIILTSEDAFSIPGGFSFNDVDLATASGGPFSERTVAAIASATDDGVSIVSGSSGSVTITLNASTGIAAGDQVRVVLGTAATHQVTGTISPINPSVPNGYRVRINTTTGGGLSIDEAKAMFIVILPITASAMVNDNAPIVSNGLPTGTIPAGSVFVEITFETDVEATCRVATTTGMTYGSMPNTASNIGGILHYKVFGGHADGGTYHYYIRCRDLFGATAQSDYDLSFTLAPTPTLTSSDGNTPGIPSSGPPGTPGNGGVGPFPNGSSVLYQSSIVISGWAPVGSAVTILKDGKQQSSVNAASNGAFSANITSLERGTYTFVTFASDSGGNKSSRFSSTLTLNAGTNNAISNVLLSPIIKLETDSVDIGAPINLAGSSVPDTQVQILVRDVPAAGQAGIAKEYTASSTSAGTWSFVVPAKDLKRGTYEVKVKTVTPSVSSEFGAPTYVGVGEKPAEQADTGNRSDINKDGKVNLVDFSILLTHWNESDDDADINLDGTVNLSDFSILLFNWTG